VHVHLWRHAVSGARSLSAGAVQGYRAILGILPERDLGVAILWNSESGAPSGLFPTVLDHALKLPAKDWLRLEQLRRAR